MVVRVRFAVVAVLVWLASVAGVSAVAWVAIDRSGRDITTASVPLPRVRDGPGVSSAPQSVAATTGVASRPQAGPQSSPWPSASTTTLSPASTTSHEPPSAAEPLPSGAPSTATAQDRTVTVPGGQVSVRCVGDVLTLRVAQPDNGWRAVVDRSDRSEIEVNFGRGSGDTGSKTHVRVTCAGGGPVFAVETGD